MAADSIKKSDQRVRCEVGFIQKNAEAYKYIQGDCYHLIEGSWEQQDV